MQLQEFGGMPLQDRLLATAPCSWWCPCPAGHCPPAGWQAGAWVLHGAREGKPHSSISDALLYIIHFQRAAGSTSAPVPLRVSAACPHAQPPDLIFCALSLHHSLTQPHTHLKGTLFVQQWASEDSIPDHAVGLAVMWIAIEDASFLQGC